MENKEITTCEIGRILSELNGYVVVPLDMLERLEKAETKLSVVTAVLASTRDYELGDLLRKILGVPGPKEDDE